MPTRSSSTGSHRLWRMDGARDPLAGYAIRPSYTLVKVSENLRALLWCGGEARIVDRGQVDILDRLSGAPPERMAGVQGRAQRDALESLMAQGFLCRLGARDGAARRRSAAFWESFNEVADYAGLEQTGVVLSSV